MSHVFEAPIDLPSAARDRLATAGSKRKRHAAGGSDASNHQDLDTEGDDTQADQEDDEVPGGFPHVPLKATKPRVAHRERNVKRQHFYVLSAILHRSLLDHHYERAKKAFALLLRFRIEGHRLDIRKKGLWGIGAELLLRVPTSGQDADQNSTGGQSQFDAAIDRKHSNKLPFSHEGFEAARNYYKRLILQYPYRKQVPDNISSQTFYPALYTIWIFQIQGQHGRGDHDDEHSTSSSSIAADMLDAEERYTVDEETTEQQRQDDCKAELEQAEGVLSNLSDLTISPPYDRDILLLKIHARVERWIADLIRLSGTAVTEEAKPHRDAACAIYRQVLDQGGHLSKDEMQLVKRSSNPDGLGAAKTFPHTERATSANALPSDSVDNDLFDDSDDY